MKIIIGLGNPGLKYAGTRHNMGFSVVTALSDKFKIRINKKELKSMTGHGVIDGEKVVLAMPQTYMNLSGEAVRALLDFYKCDISDLIIAYDDVDLEVGRIRIRPKGSAGGHNGIKNIIQHLGTEDFTRIKVGVGSKEEGWDMVDHVLGRFPKEQLPDVRDAVDRAASAAVDLLTHDTQYVMNKYN